MSKINEQFESVEIACLRKFLENQSIQIEELKKEREIQKKLFENYVAVHQRTLMELEDSRKIQKEKEEKIKVITEENGKFVEIRGKLNKENEKLREESEEMKRKFGDIEEKSQQEQENQKISMAKLTEELAECQTEREIQKKQFENYVDVHERTLLELENSRKVQKEQKEIINILSGDNRKFIEIRQKLNEENEEIREQLREMKLKLEDIEDTKTFQIFIKIRRHITLDVKKSDTIADVKEKMRKEGFSCIDFLLVYGGKPLNDTRTLFYYNIQKESTLFNLTPQNTQQDLTEKLIECRKEREIQKKLFDNYAAVHEKTLLELEDARKIQKEQEEKIDIMAEENENLTEIRQKLNEENEEIRKELRGMKRKLEDVEENLTSKKSRQDQENQEILMAKLTDELVESQKEREIQKNLFENHVAEHKRTLLQLEDSKKIQKEQDEKINILTEENENLTEIRGKLNEEKEKIREELEEMKRKLEDIEANKTFQIFIKIRRYITLNVKKIDKIEDVKMKMFKKGFSCNDSFLIYGGKPLYDSFTVSHYNIQRGSTLFVSNSYFRKNDHTQ
ncbi:hypothetical protein B9Z55_007066 [Caenorhabditis nigoni]|uniref:Ubiquitin-like domain-containing protein n=1 Tax=Caenorhabditis nigoni TaxID=1611254 RepID=A0A2G5V7W4_9PELO|nr:hypothetical protein B9Z55_007066 [Caenorhabditis nigoni]